MRYIRRTISLFLLLCILYVTWNNVALLHDDVKIHEDRHAVQLALVNLVHSDGRWISTAPELPDTTPASDEGDSGAKLATKAYVSRIAQPKKNEKEEVIIYSPEERLEFIANELKDLPRSADGFVLPRDDSVNKSVVQMVDRRVEDGSEESIRGLERFVIWPRQGYRNNMFDNYNQPFFDKKAKLSFCWIPKNACTQLKALFCRANGKSFDMEHPGRSIHSGCIASVPRGTNKEKQHHWTDQSWKHWAVIRDPLDRFLSGWVDRCYRMLFDTKKYVDTVSKCYGCLQDVRCFLRRHYYNLQFYTLTGKYGHRRARELRFNDHYFPQFWFCGFADYYKQYERFFTYGRDSAAFKAEIQDAFVEIGWSQKIFTTGWGKLRNKGFMDEVPATPLSRNETTHVKQHTLDALKTDVEIAEYFFRIYLVDYVMFDFEPPSWLTNVCEKCKQELGMQTCRNYVVCNLNTFLEEYRTVLREEAINRH